jgi:hypothetical protein
MKKIIQTLTVALLFMVPITLMAQPMPYEPGVNGGTGSNPAGGGPPGGGAPIGSGLVIMLVLGAAYGSKKVFEMGVDNPGEHAN